MVQTKTRIARAERKALAQSKGFHQVEDAILKEIISREKAILRKGIKALVSDRARARVLISAAEAELTIRKAARSSPRDLVPSSWAHQVKARDGCCIICGSQVDLEAHHIIPVSVDPSHAGDVSIGVTLCAHHHRLDKDSIHRQHGLDSECFWSWVEDHDDLVL